MVEKSKLIGPFSQILTMRNLPLCGPLSDDQLEIIIDGGIIINKGKIIEVGNFCELLKSAPQTIIEEITFPMVLMPGMIDAHTHICYAGNRAHDYALRIAGESYLDIAKKGGGILSTVKASRKASQTELEDGLLKRCGRLINYGVTTCEVKSGYGLSIDDELKMLRAIKAVNEKAEINLIPTCLAAHTLPPEYNSHTDYLSVICKDILPIVKNENLSKRVDIFVEESAFNAQHAHDYLQTAKGLNFDITVHADQFSTSGSKLAAKFSAASADHLESSGDKEIHLLAKNKIPGVLLPGASLGLGMNYPKARLMLDKGLCIAIASDWNPGSAPMGDLLIQAAVLSASEKLNTAETLAALTFRAAHALKINTKGRLNKGMQADMIAFPTSDFRNILYHQGTMKPEKVWIEGNMIR